jgi:hypothetical protein
MVHLRDRGLRPDYDLARAAVLIGDAAGARIKDLVAGSGIPCEDRGVSELKAFPANAGSSPSHAAEHATVRRRFAATAREVPRSSPNGQRLDLPLRNRIAG